MAKEKYRVKCGPYIGFAVYMLLIAFVGVICAGILILTNVI